MTHQGITRQIKEGLNTKQVKIIGYLTNDKTRVETDLKKQITHGNVNKRT